MFNDELSISVIADAIEKNGYKQAFGSFVIRESYDSPVEAACALGQAGLNLDVPGVSLLLWLDKTYYKYTPCPSSAHSNSPYSDSLGGLVTHLNDYHRWKLSSIARFLRSVE